MPETYEALPEIEALVLGGLMWEGKGYDAAVVMEYGSREMFSTRQNRQIFDAIGRLFVSGRPIEPDLVFAEAFEHGDISCFASKKGGSDARGSLFRYVTALRTRTSPITDVSHYVKVLRDRYHLQKLGITGDRIKDLAGNVGERTVKGVVQEAQGLVDRVITYDDSFGHDIRVLTEESEAELRSIQNQECRSRGVESGFVELDRLTLGFRPGDFYIVGGRPSVGKTSLCLDLIVNMRLSTVFFSIEMSAVELTNRLLASISGVSLHKIRSGQIPVSQRASVEDAAGYMKEMNLYIEDSPSLTPRDIRTRLRILSAKRDVKLVMVDYVQLMNHHRRFDNRQQELTAVSRDLKTIAREHGVILCVFSQLSRIRDKRKPRLEDLRDTGALEQDADVVMFLHQDKPDRKCLARFVDLIVAKQRNGPIGSLRLVFWGPTTTFRGTGNLEWETRARQEEGLGGKPDF